MEKKLIVLVTGYCPPTVVDEQKAHNTVVEIFNKIQEKYPNSKIELVSGLTNVGIMTHAYEEGKKRGWYLVGYACKKAADFELYPVDESHLIGDNWGDESEAFINHALLSNYPFIMVNIAGGPQAEKETKAIQKAGGEIFKVELKRK